MNLRVGESIVIYEYYGNNFEVARKATLFCDGTITYEPEPIYEEEGE